MNARDIGLALFIVAVWGANFTVIKIGLDGVPPLLLAAARYIVVALPAVFFVRRPNVSWGHLLAYGFTVGAVQFGALFYAMQLGMPAGLSSVVMQSQPFFTVAFAYWLLQERITRRHVAGMAVAALGLVFIAIGQSGVDGSARAIGEVVGDGAAGIGVGLSMPGVALLLTLVAAASWGLSNIIVRRVVGIAEAQGESVDMRAFVVWSALVPPIPLLAMALFVHGPQDIVAAFSGMTFPSVFAVAYLAYGATLFGYGGWSRLLAKYPASTVGPFSLLVPVTGLLTAGLVLSERLSAMQWLGSVCIVAGLLIITGNPFPGRQRVSKRGETY